MFTKIGEERAFDAILGQIIENIQTGWLKAGDALPAERSMAESMGVSRPAVREVLRALELLGIVKSVPGGGNILRTGWIPWLIGPLSLMFRLNNGYLKQNQQLRAALERETAILAAKKCTPLDAAELRMILQGWMRQSRRVTAGNWISSFIRKLPRLQTIQCCTVC